MQKYVFRKHRNEYSSFFRLEKRKLIQTLGLSAKTEHIGSTAIPGLGGKGILDILVGVSKPKLAKAKQQLETAGYEFREKAGTSKRLFFQRDYAFKKGNRRVHLHLVRFGGPDWNETICFRDYLLKHPEAVQQYEKIKKEAAQQALGDKAVYQKHKEKFIEGILEKARLLGKWL